MTMLLSEETQSIICKRLNMSCLEDVVEKEYGSISASQDTDREKTALYASHNRGSIRLNTGRYYTAQEYAERVKRVTNMKLPS